MLEVGVGGKVLVEELTPATVDEFLCPLTPETEI